MEIPRNNKLKFKNYGKQQRVPFTIYADTEAYLIPSTHFQFEDTPRKLEETKNNKDDDDNDLCLETLANFFNYTNEDPDMDMTSSDDDDDRYYSDGDGDDNDDDNNDTEEEGDEEENNSTSTLENNHPWSSKRLKITTSEDIDLALDKLQQKSGVLNKHRMASYAVTVTCPPHLKHHFQPVYLYRGERAEEKFVQLLAFLQEKIEALFESDGQTKMIPLTSQQESIYNSTKTCHICKENITYEKSMIEWQNQMKELKEQSKPIGYAEDGKPIYKQQFRSRFKSEIDRLGPGVMDHDHWTGAFRGDKMFF